MHSPKYLRVLYCRSHRCDDAMFCVENDVDLISGMGWVGEIGAKAWSSRGLTVFRLLTVLPTETEALRANN